MASPVRSAARLLALLAAGRFLAFVTRLNIVAFYPELMAALSTTYTGVGALFSVFFIGYSLVLIPAGIAADRGRPLRQISLGLAAIGLAGGALGLATSYGTALAARLAEGAGVALLYTASLKLLASEFPREHRGRAMGIMEIATGLGMLTSISVFAALARWVSYRGLLLSLPVMCLAALAFSLTGRSARAAGPPVLTPLPLRSVLTRQLALVVGASFIGLFALAGVVGWLPTHLTEAGGLTKAQAGLVTGVMLVVQIASVYPGGSLSDRMGRRLPLVRYGTVVFMAGLLGLAAGGTGPVAYLLAAVLGVGMSWSITPLTVLSVEKFGAERAGIVGAVTVAMSQAGSGLAGVVYGWVLDLTGSFALLWLLGAGLLAARLLLLARIAEGTA